MLMARLDEEEDPYLKGVRARYASRRSDCSLPFAKITQLIGACEKAVLTRRKVVRRLGLQKTP